ncbi:MAG: PQQ-binding-like beta-propeller repeat protein [Phycisphaeraceae bacterium]
MATVAVVAILASSAGAESDWLDDHWPVTDDEVGMESERYWHDLSFGGWVTYPQITWGEDRSETWWEILAAEHTHTFGYAIDEGQLKRQWKTHLDQNAITQRRWGSEAMHPTVLRFFLEEDGAPDLVELRSFKLNDAGHTGRIEGLADGQRVWVYEWDQPVGDRWRAPVTAGAGSLVDTLHVVTTGDVLLRRIEVAPQPPSLSRFVDLLELPDPPPVAAARDWAAMEQATWTQWLQALDAQEQAAPREQIKRVWRGLLLEALLERFDEPADLRLKARHELVDIHDRLRLRLGSDHHHWAILNEPAADQAAILQLLRSMMHRGSANADRAMARYEQFRRDGKLHARLDLALDEWEHLFQRRVDQARFGEAYWLLQQFADEQERDERLRTLIQVMGATPHLTQEHRPLIENTLLDDYRLDMKPQSRTRVMEAGDLRRQAERLLFAGELAAGPDQAERALDQLDALFETASQAHTVVAQSDRVYVDTWNVIEAMVRDNIPPALRTLLSQRHEAAVQGLRPFDSLDDVEVMTMFRRYPYAPTVQQLMLGLAEENLREGRFGMADRGFEELSRVTDAAQLRERAQAGRATAKASRPVETPISEVDQPWQLRHVYWPDEAGDAPRITDALPRATLRPIELVMTGTGTFAADPGLLAAYAPDRRTPRWVRHAPWTPGQANLAEADTTTVQVLPGLLRTASDPRQVVLRWGWNATQQQPQPPVAFNRRNGQQQWAARTATAWHDRRPLGSPAIGEQVYQLAISGERRTADLWLICHHAATGAVLWERRLAEVVTDLVDTSERSSDVARFGATVTADDGAIYIASQLGVVARLDARNGQIDWLHLYNPADAPDPEQLRVRAGHKPLLSEGHVIIIPRDRHGVFALDRQTGELAWDRLMMPSWRTAGIVDGTLILAEQHMVVGVAPASGERRWTRLLAAPILHGPVAAERSAWLVDVDGSVIGMDAHSGTFKSLHADPVDALAKDQRVLGLAALGGQVTLLVDEPDER